MTFKLPELGYDYNALEPHIDKMTMEIHHTKHHQAYIDNLNKALDGHEKYQEMSIKDLVANLNSLPDEIKTAVRNNGGGHLNHKIFWKTMSPNGGGNPLGQVAKGIDEDLGGFEKFKEEFKKLHLEDLVAVGHGSLQIKMANYPLLQQQIKITQFQKD